MFLLVMAKVTLKQCSNNKYWQTQIGIFKVFSLRKFCLASAEISWRTIVSRSDESGHAKVI